MTTEFSATTTQLMFLQDFTRFTCKAAIFYSYYAFHKTALLQI